MSFKVRPIPATIAHQVRTEMRSPQYGHPAHRERAAGYGPCRVCLEKFDVDREDRILFTFNPYIDGTTLAAPSPVIIHADECEPFSGAGFPSGLRSLPLVLEPTDRNGLAVSRTRPDPEQLDEVLGGMLRDPAVVRITVRHAEAGCFIAHVTRE